MYLPGLLLAIVLLIPSHCTGAPCGDEAELIRMLRSEQRASYDPARECLADLLKQYRSSGQLDRHRALVRTLIALLPSITNSTDTNFHGQFHTHVGVLSVLTKSKGWSAAGNPEARGKIAALKNNPNPDISGGAKSAFGSLLLVDPEPTPSPRPTPTPEPSNKVNPMTWMAGAAVLLTAAAAFTLRTFTPREAGVTSQAGEGLIVDSPAVAGDDPLGMNCVKRPSPSAHLLDIVFVHGLGGGSHSTWRAGGPGHFLPQWVAEDFPSAAVWTLGYEASPSAWLGEAMPIADRGTTVLEQLFSERVGERPLVFIAHSLGGIVVKQLLNHSATQGVDRWTPISKNVKGIAFVATPHSGARIAEFVSFSQYILRTNEVTRELASHDSRLNSLHGWFLNYRNTIGFPCRTYCERKEVRDIPFLGLRLPRGLLVVDATSAEPNIPGERAIPLDEDHLSICKPRSRDADLYKSLKRFLEGVVEKLRAA